jgi:hypothetical protein
MKIPKKTDSQRCHLRMMMFFQPILRLICNCQYRARPAVQAGVCRNLYYNALYARFFRAFSTPAGAGPALVSGQGGNGARGWLCLK